MKKLLAVILAMVVLGAVVPSCGGAHRYDGRLAAVDSLMKDNPDSALALVLALDTADILAEGDRAYRALLLTQARYKSYVTATSDSDINQALAYFRAHPADREKLTRAYIYKGAVMNELGYHDSAMFYYKHAEATAAPDDYFNLGYANMRIAQLYQRFYANDSAVLARMKIASRCFQIVQDTSYLITTIGTQGCYPKLTGEDSACANLRRAIHLAQMINSPKGLQYQSKLAGIYYFKGNYKEAKELAMDMLKKGGDKCNEQQFYYYAARSYIQLQLLDSARWVMSRIPSPQNSIDSFNHYQTLAELSVATHRLSNYIRFSQAAKAIDYRLMESSRSSKLTETELKCEASQRETALKDEADSHLTMVIGLVLLAVALGTAITIWCVKRLIHKYRSQLTSARQDIENMLGDIDGKWHSFELEKERLRHQLDEKSVQLAVANQKNIELENVQTRVNKQVSNVVRYRHAALNDLYQVILVKSVTDDGRRQVLPLMGIIKELFETKGILNKPPQKSFWNNLKLSVDGEYLGIASYVEQHYKNLSEKDMHLFLLLCAKFPNQIIKLCMNYAHDVTVSKNKKRLMKEKIGLDLKLEDFIQLYLEGNLRKDNHCD